MRAEIISEDRQKRAFIRKSKQGEKEPGGGKWNEVP